MLVDERITSAASDLLAVSKVKVATNSAVLGRTASVPNKLWHDVLLSERLSQT